MSGLRTKTFSATGEFVAYDSAVAFCKSMGFSVGTMQRDAPIGIMRGAVSIAKWRNLSTEERKALHGTITGSKRVGPVTVKWSPE